MNNRIKDNQGTQCAKLYKLAATLTALAAIEAPAVSLSGEVTAGAPASIKAPLGFWFRDDGFDVRRRRVKQTGHWDFEERALARLVAPEVLLPVQFFEGGRGDNPATRALKRLMLAVLEDALRCLQSYAGAHSASARRAYLQTKAWIAERDGNGPFAFETICEVLGIEPDRLRKGIQDWYVQISRGTSERRLTRRSIGGTGGILRCRPRRNRRRT